MAKQYRWAEEFEPKIECPVSPKTWGAIGHYTVYGPPMQKFFTLEEVLATAKDDEERAAANNLLADLLATGYVKEVE